ncbi:polysaccharide deacetylase [Streptomyces asiaticus]|uniref:polysaccharide deacetylase family protein n=1 Tax=Streptomyces asiaticus TaxID=114695 RepID=UPI0039BEAD3E
MTPSAAPTPGHRPRPGAVDRPRWPGRARCAVLLSFDVDGPALLANLGHAPDIWRSPRLFSLGAYGPHRGTPRILDLLEDFRIPATFFVPGWTAESWPDLLRTIADRGHELGHHGYLHELYYSRTIAEQRALIERSQEIFQRVAGTTAVGFRTPSGDFSADSPQLLCDLGFSYSSSMRGDDRPYRWRIDGRDTDLIEIPAQWELDDFPQFAYNDVPAEPRGQDRIAGTELTLDNWRREFDGYYRYGLCYVVMMHPEVMGKPSRVLLLRRLIEHIRSHDDVWFATGSQIAQWWRTHH